MARKKARMTDRERVEALLKHKKPDRVPIWPIALGFCTLHVGGSITDAYNNPAVFLSGQRQTSRDFGWIFFPMMGASAALAREFGGEIKLPSSEFSQAPTIQRYPVQTEKDVWNLKMPDVKTAGTVPVRIEFYKLAMRERLDNEPFNIMVWEGGPFTNATNICGIDKMGRWILKHQEAVHRLIRITVDYYVELTKYWKAMFGTEGALPFYGEPTASNQILSPKQFEQFVLPYNKELCQKVLAMGYKHIFVHICGEQNLNLPYWVQIPFGDPGIISIGHEVELQTAAKYFPNDIIMGNLEMAIIQTGTPQEVYEATSEVVRKGKELPGGYIFSPGCELPPRAPAENVMAMTQAVNDYGWYD
jgi:uroporphyrinogen decarboxylase